MQQLEKIRTKLWDLKNQLSRVPDGAFSARQLAGQVVAKLMDIVQNVDHLLEHGQDPVSEPKPEPVTVPAEEPAEVKPKKKPRYQVAGGQDDIGNG